MKSTKVQNPRRYNNIVAARIGNTARMYVDCSQKVHVQTAKSLQSHALL